ncbi:MAG: hypothetical protein VX622_12885, partial [Pseudomonadota bacterium]|nr:hypothetical protein [Pseudomonadota bacterium]
GHILVFQIGLFKQTTWGRNRLNIPLRICPAECKKTVLNGNRRCKFVAGCLPFGQGNADFLRLKYIFGFLEKRGCTSLNFCVNEASLRR